MSGGEALRELDSLIRTVDDSVHDPLGAVIKRQLRSVRVHVVALAGTPESRETLDVEGVIAELVSVEARLDNARLDVSRTLRTLQGIAALSEPVERLARELEALEAGTHEPAVDDFGNEYLSPMPSVANSRAAHIAAIRTPDTEEEGS